MWGSLGDRLAGLGDAITTGASAHAKRAHEQHDRTEEGGSAAGAGDGGGTVVSMPPAPAPEAAGGAEGATAQSAPSADPRGQGQQQQQQQLPRWATSIAASVSDKDNQQAALGALRGWGGAFVESTKNIVQETQRTLEKEQDRIRATAPSLFARSGPYKRDPNLPLDVEALRDAEVVYVTDRIVTLSHPHMQSTTDGDITPDRKLAAVGHLLQKRHGGRYMVWNLSEVEYDASVLDDQVLVYKFPGSPSPPLGLLLKLLMAMESWLRADERNVAVVHCLTGRGRTSTVLAAFLCWTGEAGFGDVNDALEYIARCKRVSVQALTIPSQVRYAGYFANMLDGVRPSQPPLLLKRIVMSEAPRFGKRPAPGGAAASASGDGGSSPSSPGEGKVLGCAPYLQIFKAGNLVFTTAASVNYAQSEDDLPFCASGDGPVSFLAEAVVQGDVLLRCRHLTKSGQRVSMFRCALHTGYVPPKVLRLTKAQLDGACGDRRFSDDFFLDLVFEACDEATATEHLRKGQEEIEEGEDEGDEAANEAARRRSLGSAGSAEGSGGNVVSASAYDTMLHRDSRFWDVISQRREENMRKRAEREKKVREGGAEAEKEDDGAAAEKGGDEGDDAANLLSGPTIGRRRDFAEKRPDAGAPAGEAATKARNAQRDPMSAFSIGEEFAPHPTPKPPASPAVAQGKALEVPMSPPPKERDSLMEALEGLDDDGLDDEEGEVVFDDGDDEGAMTEDAMTSAVPEPPLASAASVEALSADDGDAVPSEAAPAPAQETHVAMDGGATEAPKEEGGGTEGGPEADADLLPDVEGLGEGLDDLDIGDAGDDLGDVGEFDDVDDFEDDAELEDLENFLTQVTTK